MRLFKNLYGCFLSLFSSGNFPANFIALITWDYRTVANITIRVCSSDSDESDISSTSLSVSLISAMTNVCFNPSSSIRKILWISLCLDLLLLLQLTQQNFHYYLQGGEGDCFYVVGNGEFEVMATQVYFDKCFWSGVFYVLFLSHSIFSFSRIFEIGVQLESVIAGRKEWGGTSCFAAVYS